MELNLLSKYGKQRLLVSLHVIAENWFPQATFAHEYILQVAVHSLTRQSF